MDYASFDTPGNYHRYTCNEKDTAGMRQKDSLTSTDTWSFWDSSMVLEHPAYATVF